MAKRNPIKLERRNVIYQPPAANTIYQYTRIVCKDLGESIDPDFDTPDMRSEMANFIKIIADIGAAQMNKSVTGLDTK